MHPLLRILGIELLARLARRLPGSAARLASAVLLVVVNLLPVWAVLRGSIGMGDVFAIYWFENVVVWATGIVRIATAEGTGGPQIRSSGPRIANAAFFALHYGVFTFVHGVFTLFMVVLTGLDGGIDNVLWLAAAITVSHLVSLGLNWFGRDERLVVSPGQAMSAPYPRMIVLHVSIIAGFFFVIGGPAEASRSSQVGAVALLCGLKTLIDLAFHIREHRVRQARTGEGIYGAPAPE